MEYNFRNIEQKWQEQWRNNNVYRVSNKSTKPKYYVLDMFPYPSGAGLHVGHPLGYIASDIYSRYKRLKGFNVLHPMGFDSFGLPAEQYAIETGQHPAVTTAQNIKNFKDQLEKIGFDYDWEREVQTSDPNYYKWTQTIFLKIYHSFYNRNIKKAEPIEKLIAAFETNGNAAHVCPANEALRFTAAEWKNYSEAEQNEVLMQYRLAFSTHGEVNWCEALGTVLANDEVINGLSERGGHPVEKRKMRQWYLRITEYADRLLNSLEHIQFSDAMKDMQSNWIGKSQGAEIDFAIANNKEKLRVYTTRPDTIFGVDFMVIAPEHELVPNITSTEQKTEVDKYVQYVKSRSERDRMAEKKITGCFTGSYALNPFSQKQIPIYLSEYVLAGYGTGAIMAVPCGDERDFKFAQHFNIPITNIIGQHYNGTEANATKEAILENSDFLNGLVMKEAMVVALNKIEERNLGKRKTNYRMRDAGFSRQRYWGEPFPVLWNNNAAYTLPAELMPLALPHLDEIKHGSQGRGPLANSEEWMKPVNHTVNGETISTQRETDTMPGYAGSSWYFLRYMDVGNTQTFCSKEASDYWNQVDLYVGGTEHAVGHLLYSRMWTKILYDLGEISFDEPFKKLVNQGMIQGSSRLVYRKRNSNVFISAGLIGNYEVDPLYVDVNIVDGLVLDTEKFKQWRQEYKDASFELENGEYICGSQTEKMSKRLFNTVNPSDVVDKYGADTFRMYEMFLGPLEMSKPWDTKGIEGVNRFIRKLWRLFFDEQKGKIINNDKATEAELKILHKTIKKIDEDTERFSYNTAVSAFMVCVNELTDVKCHKKEILEQLLVLLTPYAPHVCEELWSSLGNTGFVIDASYPSFNAEYLIENTKEYPVSINGKTRTTMHFPTESLQADVEPVVMENESVKKWIEGKELVKFIFVKGRMINIVIK
jgi:leucyl-tRNA synthetase